MFLVLLLVFVLEKFFGWCWCIQCDGVWFVWLSLVEDLFLVFCCFWLGLLFVVVLLLLLLVLLLILLQLLVYGWLSFLLYFLVVVYSFGCGDVMVDFGLFCDVWWCEEVQVVFYVVECDLGILGGSESELIGWVYGYLFWQGYQSFFVVIFWYVLFGLVVVLVYCLLVLVLEYVCQLVLCEQVVCVWYIFDWLLVCVLVLSFVLVGNFFVVICVLLYWLLVWDILVVVLLGKVGWVVSDVEVVELGVVGVVSLDVFW